MAFDYLDKMFETSIEENALSNKTLENVQKLDKFILDNFKITFGNRIMKQLKRFVPVFVACGNSETSGIDYFVARKVLRKFEALNLSFLHPELESLIEFLNKQYGKDQCPECIEYIRELIKNS